jgi:hypothetical protein
MLQLAWVVPRLKRFRGAGLVAVQALFAYLDVLAFGTSVGILAFVRLCERIEAEQPGDLPALYVLTEAATEEFNALEAEFEAAGSEIETVAREVIAEGFWFVASAYGFPEADIEKLVATRDW